MTSVNQANMTDILASIKVSKRNQTPPKHKRGEKFLKGPIPWNWLTKAASISGNAVIVSLAIWHLAGVMQHKKVKLSNKILGELGVDRSGKYRALKQLKEAALVEVSQSPGCAPEITILDVD